MRAKVLVVCTANIARSPLAEVLLRGHTQVRGLAEQVRVTSAGVRAEEGRAAAPTSVRIAERWGFDLSDHRASAVTDEGLATTNLVLAMTADQRDRLSSRAAGLGARCFTVVEFSRLIGSEPDGPGHDHAAAPLGHHVDLVAQQAHRRRPRSVPGPHEDVPDPYGHDEDAYIEVANLLAAELAVVADALFGRVDEL